MSNILKAVPFFFFKKLKFCLLVKENNIHGVEWTILANFSGMSEHFEPHTDSHGSLIISLGREASIPPQIG